MCKWGTSKVLHTVRRYRDTAEGERSKVTVDACIAPLVQLMNDQGIETIGCCCGHGKGPGDVCVSPDSIPLLDQYGYKWIWPRDSDQSGDETSARTKAWFARRTDMVIVPLPQIEITWSDDDPEVIDPEVLELQAEWEARSQAMREASGTRDFPYLNGGIIVTTREHYVKMIFWLLAKRLQRLYYARVYGYQAPRLQTLREGRINDRGWILPTETPYREGHPSYRIPLWLTYWRSDTERAAYY